MKEFRVYDLSTVVVAALVAVFFALNYNVVVVNAGGRCADHNYWWTDPRSGSHTVRARLHTSSNQLWKQAVASKYPLTPPVAKSSAAGGAHSFGQKNSRSPPQFLLKEVSLHDVRVDANSLHGQKQQATLEYLLMLDVDAMAFTFRNNSGVPNRIKPIYGGWEAPDFPLRGHFIGHYLSASAKMWASTHNDVLRQKMTALVSALKECQDKVGTGYLSAFPVEYFDKVEELVEVWAPYYTVHKIMAGLLDQHIYAQNGQALKMLTWMVDYFYNRVTNVITTFGIDYFYTMLNEEYGGMNDLLYQLYSITRDPKHLDMAHLFDKPCFLGPLAINEDFMSSLHANTHIPIVVGAQMRYELLGDEVYKDVAINFMDIVNSSHSFATGGTSVNEHWSDTMRLASNLTVETEESCSTYNMLKVSRNLFRWTKDVIYADHYERALTNGVLGILRGTEPGVMIYMLPLGHGVSKGKSLHGWGTPFESFWCCYGTGIESFSKIGDSIYFEEPGKVPALYVIQYISSTLTWRSANLVLHQVADNVVSWNPRLHVAITVTPTKGAALSTLNLRIPTWSYAIGAKATLNGLPLQLPKPGSFLTVTRRWTVKDTITLELPFGLRTETIQDYRPEYATLQAILYGPYLLGGLSDGDFDIKTGPVKSLNDWITPIPANYNSQLITLGQDIGNSSMIYLSTKDKSSLVMESPVDAFNNSFVHSTFRVIPKDPAPPVQNPQDNIGRMVMLEPVDLPGMVVAHQGKDGGITLVKQGGNNANATGYLFKLSNGLSGKNATVSLEAADQPGCFVNNGGRNVTLNCKGAADGGFNDKASFVLSKGIKQFHPISFLAKGVDRSYVLEPIFSFANEYYNVYFNITT